MMKNSFELVLGVMVITIWVHVLAIFFKIGIPFLLLYSPILFFLHTNIQGKVIRGMSILFHLLPFLLFSILYLIMDVRFERWYYEYYLGASVVSLVGYILFLWKHKKKRTTKATLKVSLLEVLLRINLIVSLFVLFIFLKIVVELPTRGMGTLVLYLALILAFSSILGVRYLFRANSRRVDIIGIKNLPSGALGQSSQDLVSSHKATLPNTKLEEYEARINDFLLSNALWLNPDLSLERFSQKTGIPKHHVSQVLRVHLDTNFYQFIAKYRIAHAVELLESGSLFTIESLASECGFNSKTSFNRYFKEIQGCTPSEYRSALIT